MAKKHTPSTDEEKPERKPYAFMDKAEFVWDGERWQLEPGWLDPFLNRYNTFVTEKVTPLYGEPPPWMTVDHAETQVRQCSTWPVFNVDPDPMFLHAWVVTWVDTQSSRIWNQVYETLRLGATRMPEFEAAVAADEVAREWDVMFDPTWPRPVQKLKKRKAK
jgi:hypothetical protein